MAFHLEDIVANSPAYCAPYCDCPLVQHGVHIHKLNCPAILEIANMQYRVLRRDRARFIPRIIRANSRFATRGQKPSQTILVSHLCPFPRTSPAMTKVRGRGLGVHSPWFSPDILPSPSTIGTLHPGFERCGYVDFHVHHVIAETCHAGLYALSPDQGEVRCV